MTKSLSTILTVFKIFRIVAKVIFILCIIGAVGSLLGVFTLPLAIGLLPPDLLLETGIDAATVYPDCIVGVVTCAGEAVFAFMAERYFKNVLAAETPFTFDGAKECFRLGIASIIISLAMSVAVGIVCGIFALLSPDVFTFDIESSMSLSTGLFFLFLSVIFKHGAELQPPVDFGNSFGDNEETHL